MHKQNATYFTMEYYLAIKRNEMVHATWMNLESIMLNKRSQREKTTYIISFAELDFTLNLEECPDGMRTRKLVLWVGVGTC